MLKRKDLPVVLRSDTEAKAKLSSLGKSRSGFHQDEKFSGAAATFPGRLRMTHEREKAVFFDPRRAGCNPLTEMQLKKNYEGLSRLWLATL